MFNSELKSKDPEALIFNFENLSKLIDHFSLRDLFQLNTIGCTFKEGSDSYLLWMSNKKLFVNQPQNSLILLNFSIYYNLLFPIPLVKSLIQSNHTIKKNAIKENWGDLTRELSKLLLNENSLENFYLLLKSGIFQLLFPKAAHLVKNSSIHKNYILGILTATQQNSRPSISFIYSHFLALEIAQTAENSSQKVIHQLSHLYDDRYYPIIEKMSAIKQATLYGMVISLKAFSNPIPKNKTSVSYDAKTIRTISVFKAIPAPSIPQLNRGVQESHQPKVIGSSTLK